MKTKTLALLSAGLLATLAACSDNSPSMNSGATGASLAAAGLPSGRPISGEPGGSGAAAAGAAAGAEAGGCWAKTGVAKTRPAIVPASKMLRRAFKHGFMDVLPGAETLKSVVRHAKARPGARLHHNQFPPISRWLQSGGLFFCWYSRMPIRVGGVAALGRQLLQ